MPGHGGASQLVARPGPRDLPLEPGRDLGRGGPLRLLVARAARTGAAGWVSARRLGPLGRRMVCPDREALVWIEARGGGVLPPLPGDACRARTRLRRRVRRRRRRSVARRGGGGLRLPSAAHGARARRGNGAPRDGPSRRVPAVALPASRLQRIDLPRAGARGLPRRSHRTVGPCRRGARRRRARPPDFARALRRSRPARVAVAGTPSRARVDLAGAARLRLVPAHALAAGGRPVPVRARGEVLAPGALNLEAFLFLLLYLALAVAAWRLLGAAYGLFCVISLALPLSTPWSVLPLYSLPRFGLVLFPFFMVLGAIASTPRRYTAIVVCSVVLLAADVARWALGLWVA